MNEPTKNQPEIQPMIDRLGFDSWCDNMFVNAMEGFVFEGTGSISVENEKNGVHMNMQWDNMNVTCTIRAYTYDGWQNYSKSIKWDGKRVPKIR